VSGFGLACQPYSIGATDFPAAALQMLSRSRSRYPNNEHNHQERGKPLVSNTIGHRTDEKGASRMKTYLPRRRPLSTADYTRGLVAALFTAGAVLGAAPASADPASPDQLEDMSAPPAVIAVPSSPPATGKSADGWTLSLSANSESLTPVPPVDPALATRDFIVGGLFNGTLRGPGQRTTPTPSGTLEVGYQILCVPSGMLSALKPAATDVKVLKEDFTGANPSAAVTAFRVQVDCMGPAVIRSYAVLTRTTNGTDAVVAYYGVSMPAQPESA
jgi:hypothetical protein